MKNPTLPRTIHRILLAIVRLLLPRSEEWDAAAMEENVMRGLSRLLVEFSSFSRFGFFMMLRFLEWGTVLFGYGFQRFSAMGLERQTKYLEGWRDSRLLPKREFFKALRGVTNLVFYSDRRVWALLGYDPEPHMEERIRLRQEILRREEQRAKKPGQAELPL